MGIGSKDERMPIVAHKVTLFVTCGIDHGSHVLRHAPSSITVLAHPDIHASHAAFARRGKKEPFVFKDSRMHFYLGRIDRHQVFRRAPARAIQVADIDIAIYLAALVIAG